MKNNLYTIKTTTGFKRWILLTSCIMACLFSVQVNAQVNTNGGSGLAASYTDLQSAITALNAATITGAVVITVTDNETASDTGYVITQLGGTSTFPITIQGSVSTLTAGVHAFQGGVMNSLFKIVGGDWITIQNFILQENAANVNTTVATNTMTEAAVLLVHASATDGAQNNTIQNNTISLNAAYNNSVAILSTSASSPGNAAQDATSSGGTNSNNKVYGNIITNVAYGVYFICPPVTATVFETGNDIGGTAGATGNTITFGNATASSGPWNRSISTAQAGIIYRNGAGNSIRFNNVTSSSLVYVGSAGLNGILISSGSAPVGVSYTSTISNNTVVISTTGVALATGIDFGHGVTTGTMAGSNNTITVNQLATAAVSAAIIGEKANYPSNGTTCSSNNITINQTYSVAATATNSSAVTALSLSAGTTGTPTATALSNAIAINRSLTSAAATTGTLSGTVTGISSTTATSTLNIGSAGNANTITIKEAVGGAGTNTYSSAINYVDVTAAHGTSNVVSNTFNTTGGTLRSTGTMQCITVGGSQMSVLDNRRNNTAVIDRVAASGSVAFSFTSGAPSEPNDSIVGNNITFTSLAGTTSSPAIINSSGGASATGTSKNINNNTISVTGTNTGVMVGILNNFSFGNLNNNTMTFNTASTSLTGIQQASSTGVYNTIANNISLTTSSTGTVTLVGITCQGSSGVYKVTNNVLTNLASTGGGAAIPTITGIAITASSSGTNVYNNTFTNLSTSGAAPTGAIAITGISVSSGTLVAVDSNFVTNISTGASSGAATIIGVAVSAGTTVNVYKNKIAGVGTTATGAASIVSGIRISGGTTVNVSNNLIGNLTNSGVSSTDAVRGINMTVASAGASYNVYYNTIRLAAAGGANYGTTGIFHTVSTVATTSKLDLRNNIVINNSTPSGTGVSVGLRRSGGAASNLANFATTSNNNIYFVGVLGGDATHLIYSDGVSTATSLAAYKAGVFGAGTIAPRDQASETENCSFTSTVSGNANFLHFTAGTNTYAESGAQVLASVPDDYDSQTRNVSTPDIGADEFSGISPKPAITNVTVPTGGNCSSVNHTITADVSTPSGTIDTVLLSYNNGAAGSVLMTLSAGTNTNGTYTGVIPGATPTNTLVTWNIRATSTVPLASVYNGTPYNDAVPLAANAISIVPSTPSFCGSGGTTTLTAVSNDGGYVYTWTSLGTATFANQTANQIDATLTQTSDFRVVGTNGACTDSAFISIGVYPFPVSSPTGPSTLCFGDSALISSGLSASNFAVGCIPYAAIEDTATAFTLCSGGVSFVPPGGTAAASLDDGIWTNVPIGFTFNYFGTNYTKINVGTNGVIGFGLASTQYQFVGGFPNVANPANTIAVGAADLLMTTAGGGTIKYWTKGYAPNRVFIVRYKNCQGYNGGSLHGYLTAEAMLFETTGNVEIHILNFTTNTTIGGLPKLIGLQDGTQTIGATAPKCSSPFTNNYWNEVNDSILPGAPLAWRFTPPHPYTVVWAPSSQISGPFSGSNLFSVWARPTAPGTVNYTITFTDAVTGCNNSTSPASFSVTTLTPPVAAVINADTVRICGPQSVTLSISNAGSLASTDTAYWYAALNGSPVGTGNSYTTPQLFATTKYYVRSYNGTCFRGLDSVVVSFRTPPAINAGLDVAICPGTSTILTATSPDANYAYSWSPGTTGASQTVSPSVPTTYIVTGTDNVSGSPDSSCVNRDTVVVSMSAAPIVNATANPSSVCSDSSSVLTAVVPTGIASAYSASGFIGTYTPLSGGGITIINTDAQLTPGFSTGNQDDGGVMVPLPFIFTYNGLPYSTMAFSTNGWLSPGSANAAILAGNDRAAGNLFTTTAPNTTIAAWFKDMGANFPAGSGSMRHGLIGTGVYAFQWDNAVGTGFSDGSAILISFQVNIYGPGSVSPGRIEALYGPTVGAISFGASLGIEDSIGGTNHYINALNGSSTSTVTSTVWPGNGTGIRVDVVPSGLTYTWSVINGPGLLSSTTSNPTNGTNITATTSYAVAVSNGTCTTIDTVVVTSAPLSASPTALAASGAYCIPLQSGSSCVNNVTINTMNSTPPGCISPFYHSNAPVGSNTTTLSAGTSYTVTVTLDAAGIVSVWLDANQDGVFDASEWVQPYINAATGSASILVPSGAKNGNTGLRVRSRLPGNINGAVDACTVFGSGSTEDYTVTIINGVFNTPCSGAAFNLAANPSGGGTPYTYSWTSNPPGFTSTLANPTVNPDTTTTYTVKVKSICGDSVIQSVTAVVQDPLHVAINPDTVFAGCSGGVISTVTLTASGADTYTWAPADSLSSTTGTSVTAHPSATTLYTVTGTRTGCSSTGTSLVQVGVPPVISVSAAATNICPETPTQLSVSVGSTVSYSGTFTTLVTPTLAQCQAWDNFCSSLVPANYQSVTISGTFDGVGRTALNPVNAQALAAALRNHTTASVVDGANTWMVGNTCGNLNGACQGSFPMELSADGTTCLCTSPGYNIRPAIGVNNWGGVNTASCGGPSQTINVTFTVPATAPTYAWTSNPAGFTSNSPTPTVAPAVTTTYYVTVTDANGCSSVDSITITTDPMTSVVISAPNNNYLSNTIPVSFSNPTTDEDISVVGTAGFICPGNNTVASFALPAVPVGSTIVGAVLSIPGIDMGGSGSFASEVSLHFSGTGITGPSPCFTGATTATIPDPFDWLTDPSDSAMLGGLLNPLGGTVTLIYSEGYNDITTGPDAQFPASGTLTYYYTDVSATPSICLGDSITLTATVTGGGTPYTYNWSDGSTGATITVAPSPAGTVNYTVTVVDACGDELPSDPFAIIVKPIPAVTITNTRPLIICSAGSFTLNVSGSAATYNWSPSGSLNVNTGTSVIATPTATTLYTVTGFGANGCTAFDSITVTYSHGVTIDSVTADADSGCAPLSTQLHVYANDSSLHYSRTVLTGQTYSTLTGGGITVINSNAGLTAGMGSVNQDDGGVLVNLPFTFNYNGSGFNQMTFCTNGWIGAGDQSTIDAVSMRIAGNLFTPTIPNNTLAAWFKDMGANYGTGFPGTMRHGLTGTDVYTFQWDSAVGSGFSNTTLNLISFQISLYGPASSDPGRIEYIYGPTKGVPSFAASEGLENASGTTYLNALNGSSSSTATSTAWPGNGNGYRFDQVQGFSYLWSPAANLSSTTSPSPNVVGLNNDTTYTVVVTNAYGCSATGSVHLHVLTGCNTVLNLTLFLQAYYQVDWQIQGLQPMDNFGSGGGLFMAAQYDLFAADTNAVDTIYVSLIDSVDYFSTGDVVFATRATATGILRTNGSLMVQFTQTGLVGNPYFWKLTQRNHVQIWTPETIVMASTQSYDFTDANTKAYYSGFGAEGQVEVEVNGGGSGSPTWAMWAGDLDQDEQVTIFDLSDETTGYEGAYVGYVVSDVTGDAQVTIFDGSYVTTNFEFGIFSQHP